MTPRVPDSSGSGWLIVGGGLSVAAAVAHLACIAGGGDWYRFFGAGEAVARAAESGSPVPALMTLAIAGVLGIWAAYAFSGAGRIRRLPLLRTGLVVISAVYLLRGSALFMPATLGRQDLSSVFILWSSAIVLVYGLAYAIGTWRAWPNLSKKEFA